jgi:hypothetical protein
MKVRPWLGSALHGLFNQRRCQGNELPPSSSNTSQRSLALMCCEMIYSCKNKICRQGAAMSKLRTTLTVAVFIFSSLLIGLGSSSIAALAQDMIPPNGQGTYTWPKGEKYIGEWRDGKRVGQGTYIKRDGTQYIGEFRDGQANRRGTYTWPDGAKYIGEFRDGKRNGQGTRTEPDGDKLVGIWKDDRFVQRTSEIPGIPIEVEAGTFIDP